MGSQKKQKSKKENANKFKSVEERLKIREQVISKLKEVSLVGTDQDGNEYSGFDGVNEMVKILNEYVKPNLMSGFSGIIKLPEFGRNIEYVLPLRAHTDHMIRMVKAD